jgi:hypothetical protein
MQAGPRGLVEVRHRDEGLGGIVEREVGMLGALAHEQHVAHHDDRTRDPACGFRRNALLVQPRP